MMDDQNTNAPMGDESKEEQTAGSEASCQGGDAANYSGGDSSAPASCSGQAA